MNKLFLLLISVCSLSVCLNAQSVIRGPYLQSAASDHITIKWRTDQPTTSKVNIGESLNDLFTSFDDSVLKTEHEIEIVNLIPNTVYYYNIANANSILVPAATDLYFRTHPVIGTEGEYKFWVLGDCGTGDGKQRDVRDAYYSYIGNDHIDGVLFLGDNAYDDGADVDYQEAVFENMYEDRLQNSIAWSTLGNHDGFSASSDSQTGVYYDIFTFPTNGESGGVASGTEAYYSFDYGNIHFICLDSYDTDRNVDSPMYTWCQNDIQDTNQEWIIAFWHHPAYSKGSHDSDEEEDLREMRENYLPMLEDNGVDLVLSGHSHSYERSFFINGHYGLSNTFDYTQHIVGNNGAGNGSPDGNGAYSRTDTDPNDGTVYITAGSSGKVSLSDLDHEAMSYSAEELGSLALEVNGDELDLKFIRDGGSIIDYFSITKNTANCVAGTPCDDNDANTINDVYNNSCGCFGTSILDSDNDGIVDSEDCRPFQALFPGTPGTPCDDGDLMTGDDVIQASGCSCLGTPIDGCDVSVAVSGNTITINGLYAFENAKIFNSSWQEQWTCNPWQDNVCDPSESFTVADGTYFVSGGNSGCDFSFEVSVPGSGCVDLDNDGICADQDCDDNNASVPTTIGSSCDDGDPSTNNDQIQSDGCTCLGVPIACTDNDNDGVCAQEDCDDSNANINPGQVEIPYNGIDDDCNAATPDDDLDQDGFPLADDCDDGNANINPGQVEIFYNGIDDDCNVATLDDDLDQDGFPLADDCDDGNANINPGQVEIFYNGIDDDCNVATLDDDLDQDGFPLANDCDDSNANVNPGQVEIAYNGIDDDCNPATLDDDLDQDGFPLANDCDDSNANVNPGRVEIFYNGIDDDCDVATLDDDLDQDGFLNAEDCDDSNANINPGQVEVAYNGIDDDCNVATLDDDLDQDSFPLANDCDDSNANVNPSQAEIPYNGIDDDCNPATLDDDLDQDGFLLAEDCDDSNANINPSQVEIAYNGIDDDCDASTLDDDLDQDGFLNAEDCDDSNANINPDQMEVAYNGIDDDCDAATLDDDLDQDGFPLANDCDDSNANVNPSQAEIAYNGIDDDCNAATFDDDLDQDGFALAEDCDDSNGSINPGQVEIAYNGIDDDCNAATFDDDLDQDGFLLTDDCDDSNGSINPGQVEIAYNGIDDDCDADTFDDDLDQDGFLLTDDCDDSNGSINPGQVEIAYNGIDDDCDADTLDDDLDQDGFLMIDDCDDNNPDINPDAEDIPNNDIDENCDGIDLITSTHDLAKATVTIYPNPATKIINIDVDIQLNFKTNLYDLSGKLLHTSTNTRQIEVASMPSGTYLLEIIDIDSSQGIIEKVVIEN